MPYSRENPLTALALKDSSMTKYLGQINNSKDLVNKEYVDGAFLPKLGKAESAKTADAATKATQDGDGNVITSTYATNTKALRVFTRADVGTAPNYDNPGFNGLFEVRNTSETPNATGP